MPPHASTTKVHQVPPEVLASIFQALRAVNPIYIHPHHNLNRIFNRTWLSVTHVSQYWRSISINLAVLWTEFTYGMLTRPRLCQMFLKRSRTALLDVETGEEPSTTCILLLMHEIHRIRSLELDIISESIVHFVNTTRLLQSLVPAPQLRDIDFSAGIRGLPSQHVPWDILWRLLRSAPALRDLRFRRTWFSWAETLNCLRELTVVDCEYVTQASFSDVLNGLRCMPALEKLVLHRAIPFEEPENFHPYSVVHLPRLHLLQLEDEGIQGLRLWSLVELHPRNCTDITARVPSAEEAIRAAAPALARYQVDTKDRPPPLSFQGSSSDLVKLHLAPASMGAEASHETALPQLILGFALSAQTGAGVPDSARQTLLLGIATALPLQMVTHLMIPGEDVSNGTEIEDVLSLTSRTIALEKITVTSLQPAGFECLASMLSRKQDEKDKLYLSVPLLQKLAFESCIFDHGSVELLFTALNTRAKAGFTLHELTVEYSVFKQDWVQRLQGVAGAVRWDGQAVSSGV